MKEGFYQYDGGNGRMQTCHVFKSAGGSWMLVDYTDDLIRPNSAASPCSRKRYKELIPIEDQKMTIKKKNKKETQKDLIEAAKIAADVISNFDTEAWPVVYVDINTPQDQIDYFKKMGCNVVIEDFEKKEKEKQERQDFYAKLLAIGNFKLDGTYNFDRPEFKTTKGRVDFFTNIENFDSIVNFIREHWDNPYIGGNHKVRMRTLLEDMIKEIAHKQPEECKDVFFTR
jgi:hypothetical protein